MKKIIAIAAMTAFVAGCTTDPYTGQQKVSNTAAGALIGAGVGALAGVAVGGSKNAQRNAVLIGAGIGALAGAGIGSYMDQQESELRAQLQGTGVSVSRVGNDIILNMPSNITFPTDRDDIQPEFRPTLRSVAIVLKKYDRTLVDVYGHTDSTGDDRYNLDLSQRRAQSVATFLSGKNVDPRRLYVAGLGESQPVAPNSTEDGRAQNRRVEIKLVPVTQG